MTRHEDAGKPFSAKMLASFVGGLCASPVLDTAKNAVTVVFRA
jgi:hypothetical protein